MKKRTLKKTKNKPRDNNILTKPIYLGDKDIPMSIELLQYDALRMEVKNMTLQSSIKENIDNSKVNWFKISGISDATQVNRICREFGLHGFDVKDLLADQQVVKIVAYDDVTFVLMSSFYLEPNITGLDDMQIAFIFGNNFIVSFQEALIPVFEEVKQDIEENNGLIRQKGTDFLLYILLNAVNLSNINTIMGIEDYLAEIEDQLIVRKDSIDILQFLHRCRVDYMHIKRSVISLREEYANLLHNTNKLISTENIVYFNDFDDRMRTMLGDLASFHESLTSLHRAERHYEAFYRDYRHFSSPHPFGRLVWHEFQIYAGDRVEVWLYFLMVSFGCRCHFHIFVDEETKMVLMTIYLECIVLYRK